MLDECISDKTVTRVSVDLSNENSVADIPSIIETDEKNNGVFDFRNRLESGTASDAENAKSSPTANGSSPPPRTPKTPTSPIPKGGVPMMIPIPGSLPKLKSIKKET